MTPNANTKPPMSSATYTPQPAERRERVDSARVTITGRLLRDARERVISDPRLTLSQAVEAEYEHARYRIRAADDLHERIRSELPKDLRPLSNAALPERVGELARAKPRDTRKAYTWTAEFTWSAGATLISLLVGLAIGVIAAILIH